MTFDQLVVFLKIIDTGSYRKAAELLYRSQPALTQSIKKLEEELTIQLFTRNSYRPTLTSSGALFMKQARLVVERMQALQVLGAELGMGIEAKVRVALDIICPSADILAIIDQVLQKSPHTELQIFTEVLGGGYERLLHHDVDFAIIPMHTMHPDLYAEQLTVVKKIAVCAPGYLPAENFDDERELRAYRQIILTDSAKKLAKLNVGVICDSTQWVVTDIYLKRSMILQGLGWGSMPEHMVNDDIRLGNLTPITIKEKNENVIPICLVRHLNQPMGPLSQTLWKTLFKHYPSNPQLAIQEPF